MLSAYFRALHLIFHMPILKDTETKCQGDHILQSSVELTDLGLDDIFSGSLDSKVQVPIRLSAILREGPSYFEVRRSVEVTIFLQEIK